MSHAMKPLSCDPAKLKGLSEKLILSHYENNYGGAVKRLNSITEQLGKLDFASAPVFLINGLKREQLVAANSMILHELYFANLGEGDGPSGALAGALERDFGSVERWRTEFTAMGKALGGGSGWVVLVYLHRDGRLMNQWAADHTQALAHSTPMRSCGTSSGATWRHVTKHAPRNERNPAAWMKKSACRAALPERRRSIRWGNSSCTRCAWALSVSAARSRWSVTCIAISLSSASGFPRRITVKDWPFRSSRRGRSPRSSRSTSVSSTTASSERRSWGSRSCCLPSSW